RYADGTAEKAEHLRDESEFMAGVNTGRLPAVSFVEPLGPENEHPGYTDVLSGEQHVVDLIAAIQRSPLWSSTVIIVTYDENGGFWDPVAPPLGDRWGPGARVPALVISPLARRHHVDHTIYDTTSILALIERRWHLKPLGIRDAAASPLENALTFERDED